MRGQVEEFKRHFTGDKKLSDWTGRDSLHAVFFGINDVALCFINMRLPFHKLLDSMMTVYMERLEMMYDTGARQFLILTVPPTERAPLIVYHYNVATFIAAIKAWNGALETRLLAFAARHDDVVVRVYDTAKLFDHVLDNHEVYGFPEENTYWCPAYGNSPGPPELDLKTQCRQAVANLAWHDAYHPTWPVHKALGEDIYKALSGGDAVSVVRNPRDPSSYVAA